MAEITAVEQLQATIIRDMTEKVNEERVVETALYPGSNDNILSEQAILATLPVHIGPTPPASPYPGRLWLDTSS